MQTQRGCCWCISVPGYPTVYLSTLRQFVSCVSVCVCVCVCLLHLCCPSGPEELTLQLRNVFLSFLDVFQ